MRAILIAILVLIASPAWAGVEVTAYGAAGDGVTNDCTAVTNAIATGESVHFPRGTYALPSCYLTISATGQGLFGDNRRGTVLSFTYTGTPTAPSITVGGSAVQILDVSFRSMRLQAPAGQVLFFTRWVRGVRWVDITAQADEFLKLGDDTLGTGEPTYIAEFYDGDELSQVASPTMHFVDERNFLGQLVMNDVYAEGVMAVGIDGWHGGNNIQAPDDMRVRGGYWSRFSVNWNFFGERVANAYFDNHHSEGALINAIKMGQASGASVPGGFNQMLVSNSLFDAAGDAMVFQCDRSGDLCDRLQISNTALGGTSTSTGSGLVIGTAGASVQQVDLTNITAILDPASSGTADAVRLSGSTTSGLLREVTVDGVNGKSNNANPIRAVVRVEGSGNINVRLGARVTGRNNLRFVDDQSNVLQQEPRTHTPLGTTVSFGSIPANSTASQVVTMSGVGPTTYCVSNIRSGAPSPKVHFNCSVTGANTVTMSAYNSDPTNAVTVNSVVFDLLAVAF